MDSTARDGSRMIEIKTKRALNSVLFSVDGKQVLNGGDEGILQRWRVEDGREVGKPIRIEGAEILASALSPDCKWLVCGLRTLAIIKKTAAVGVWDAQTFKRVLEVKGHANSVFSVDISPDSTKFATGGSETPAKVFIWSILTGKRLVGPLEHDGWAVVGVRFSPNGDRIATASGHEKDKKSIRIYHSTNGQRLLEIPCWFWHGIASPLAWSVDGRQLFAASSGEAKCFDTSSGILLNKWSIPNGRPTSIVLSHDQKFAAVVTYHSVSFWDISTSTEIGTALKQASTVWSIALSPNDDYIVIGEENGKVTIRSLCDILPSSHLTVNFPLMSISEAVFKPWMHSDFASVEELLTQDIMRPRDPSHHARALAYRALVRTRLKQWDMAIDDVKMSIKIQRSIIGYIAHAIALVGIGEYETAMDVFDLVFSAGLPSDHIFLLLIKAVIFFECGKHDNAITRVDHLLDVVDRDQSLYTAVKAQMFLLREAKSMKGGDNEYSIELFKLAKEAIPVQKGPHLVVVSLIFGWNFDRLSTEIQLLLSNAMCTIVETLGEGALTTEMTADWDADVIQTCTTTFESSGDEAAKSKDYKKANVRYSAALFLNPPKPAGMLVKRSIARGALGLWEDALKDADDAIKADTSSPWGYERRHAALHGLRRYDEAMSSFARMHSLIESSPDPDSCQLAKKYISPSQSEMAIDHVVRGVSKMCPLVLIDVKSGRLCDRPEQTHIFKSEPEFKELVYSMMCVLDNTRMQQVAEEYFRYVTLSHVWQGKEPSFQDVSLAGSVWELDSSPLNDKLRKFCEVVRADGYRWAWSDTCCIDKTISTVLNQSLKMMYKWYEASTATFVLLVDVEPSPGLGGVRNSKWMTRAWTSQELLAPKVIRFYACGWKPYLGDTRSNHKDSPEIMQELADAIGISRQTIITFNPDHLSVREKLRLASTRNATVEEDVAYSLIGIFKSDIRPDYGEGDAALGHLLEEIVARSGEVTILAWTGQSSSYNSCLPTTLAVYSELPGHSPTITDAEMDVRVAALQPPVSQTDAALIHKRVTRLPPARFANRRLHLPCIIFTVRNLGVQRFGSGLENHYRARVAGIGDVEFQTLDRLSLEEPRKLVFVHPWIRDLCDPRDGFTWGSTIHDDDDESDPETTLGSMSTAPLRARPAATMDEYTRALRLIVRLQQPFHALLLQQQPRGEFKRIAAEHEIIVPGIKHLDRFDRDIHTGVVEIL